MTPARRPVNPVLAGLACRCPACGEGALFDGYLKVSKRCEGCGLDLAAANSGGTTGPNLDEVLPGQSAAMVEKSIVDPNAQIAKGYPPNVMPSTFGQSLSKKEVEDLVQFLIESTSGGSKGKQSG